MTPSLASSSTSEKPRCSQKARNCGHSWSGVDGTISQRCWPWRSTRMPPSVLSATVATVAVATAAAAPAPDALMTPLCGW